MGACGPCMLSLSSSGGLGICVGVTASRSCEARVCERRARLEEREAVVAEARKRVEVAEREARELEAEQERQVWCPGVLPGLSPAAQKYRSKGTGLCRCVQLDLVVFVYNTCTRGVHLVTAWLPFGLHLAQSLGC